VLVRDLDIEADLKLSDLDLTTGATLDQVPIEVGNPPAADVEIGTSFFLADGNAFGYFDTVARGTLPIPPASLLRQGEHREIDAAASSPGQVRIAWADEPHRRRPPERRSGSGSLRQIVPGEIVQEVGAPER
jgi:hypothetical protein